MFRYVDASLFVFAAKEAAKATHFPIHFSCVLPARCQSDFARTRLASLSLLEVQGRCQEGGKRLTFLLRFSDWNWKGY